jgi:uncharacterized protein YcbK (DUF882 family)
MKPIPDCTRRSLLRGTTLAIGGLAMHAPLISHAVPLVPSPQRLEVGSSALRLHHLHTGETMALALDETPGEKPGVIALLNRFLRDHYSGVQGTMDPGLFDQIRRLQQLMASDGEIEVISGYRSSVTNEWLRRRGGGGVATRSLHLQGRALDLRIAGVPLVMLRDAALDLRAGGVGFYPESNFLHIDTGTVRRWG